jgi:hypothetical protein
MKQFGNIKDTFHGLLLESMFNKDSEGKKKFGKYLKVLKENESLKDQYLIYKNLSSKKFTDESEAKEYIKENVEMLKLLDVDSLQKGYEELLSILEDLEINTEQTELYENIEYLRTTKKTPKTLEKIQESINYIKDLMLEEVVKDENEYEVVDLPPSMLTTMMVTKYNTKYSDISEGEKKVIKSILNGTDEDKKDIYESIKRECIDTIDQRLDESTEIDIQKKLLQVKDKLLRMEYSSDNYIQDIDKVYSLKTSIS